MEINANNNTAAPQDNSTTSSNDRVVRLKPFQSQFVLSQARYPALVSAWGTGKTLCLISAAMRLSQEFQNNQGVIFRKEYVDLRDSTIKDFHTYTGLGIDSAREVKVGSSVIMFRHLEEMNNIQNMNLGWFGIEQAEELDTDEFFFKLFGRLRRHGVPHRGMVVANTNGHNWIYRLWKAKTLEDSELIEATTFDNSDNLPPDFINSLDAIKKKKPKLYARFVQNSWDEADTTDIIIHPEWVENATRASILTRTYVKRIISIDVARYGDDKTMFYALENNKVIAREEHSKCSTMEVVGKALLFAKANKEIEWFAVDEIGVGAGVVDRLLELGKKVIAVNSSKSSINPDKYYNTRTEVYATAADLFQDQKVSIQADDEDLREQLSWAKYKMIKSNGLLQVETKDEIKKRYNRSPDNADAYLNGLWALQRVPDQVNTRTQSGRAFIPERFRRVA